MSNFYSQQGQQQGGGGFYNNSNVGGNNGSTSNFYGDNSNTQNNDQPSSSSWQNFAQPSTQNPQQNANSTTTQPSAAAAPTEPSLNMPSIFNPAMASAMATAAASASGSDPNAMINIGMNVGKNFLDEGTARMIPGFERSMRYLRIYFAVDNHYVKRKMGRVLFSFFHKTWKRYEQQDSASQTGYTFALPRNDDNAFDLYIPSMSLITYVLLCALCYGTAGKFDPEVLPDVTTKCFFTQVLEVLLFRLSFYMMQAPVQLLDLFAVTGYKYLALTVNMFVGILLDAFLETGGRKGYFIMFLWTASAVSFFMLKTMANNIPVMVSSTGPKREMVVMGFALSQFATMWFLGQTKNLN